MIPQDTSGSIDLLSNAMKTAQGRNDSLQTFVFSATMNKDLQRDLKRGKRSHTKRKVEDATTLGVITSLSHCNIELRGLVH